MLGLRVFEHPMKYTSEICIKRAMATNHVLYRYSQYSTIIIILYELYVCTFFF